MKGLGFSVRVHPLFLLVVVLAVAGGFGREILVLFAVVIIHELGHVVAASRLGYKTETIELLPFGGVARLSSPGIGWNARHETIIAIAGPLMNLMLAVGAVLAHFGGEVSERALTRFLTVNLGIMFFNLLPGLPLDGGRIARAGLAGTHGYERATKVVTRMSFYLAAVLMIFGATSLWLGFADVGLLGLGAFLLFSAYTLSRHTRYDTLRFLDAKRRDESALVMPLRALVADSEITIGEIAGRFAPGHYHVVYVRAGQAMDSQAGAERTDPIDEREILDAIFERGMWAEPLGRLLS